MSDIYDWTRCTHEDIGQPGCPTCDPDKHRVVARFERRLAAVEKERDALRTLAEKVNAIRNSIVGMQGFNFSEHAYPLVAALNEAGLVGMPYPEARANLGTIIEQRDALAALVQQLREALDRDKTGLATALNEVRREVAGRTWIVEGRGPYEWDDDRYKDEAGIAMRAVLDIIHRALSQSGKIANAGFNMKAAEALAAVVERARAKWTDDLHKALRDEPSSLNTSDHAEIEDHDAKVRVAALEEAIAIIERHKETRSGFVRDIAKVEPCVSELRALAATPSEPLAKVNP